MIEKTEEFEMLVSFKAIGSNIRAARKAQGLTQEQAAELLRAGGHKRVPGHECTEGFLRKALRRAVIPAGNAEQAGTDQNVHRTARFPRLHVKPKIMPSTPPTMCVSWARPAVPVTA